MSDLMNRITATFITDNRWEWFLRGLGFTLLISLFAVLLGLAIGILMALMRLSKNKILKFISGVYIDIIRGTPTMVQLLIIYFIIFAQVNIEPWIVGTIAFGINSGAYMAEIVRGGILSVSHGQTEAGRSLGMTQSQTMMSIIMPQAMKNIIPALGNEFIVLIKETAVIGMISNIDLVGAAKKVQSLTYDYLIPLLSIAVIYYVVIKILTIGLQKIENRLRKSDKR
ncbi:MAG: amino acid ABC transporter permease [Clostridia bacterium]|nr:amino acid ABC transporter permease [Clostridia bacterium]MBQ3471071.1 amino acid ABC transporter permease [Clostridia bacterium]MBQ6530942.1 amino acid ABC transporter permease [Clostridia bacterium]MBQ9598441.1 amino acid ABC transporter permease [Clostridia bacterium]MBR0088425.1 amino acid ABC transporter permease [Clostridia bacterium]